MYINELKIIPETVNDVKLGTEHSVRYALRWSFQFSFKNTIVYLMDQLVFRKIHSAEGIFSK